MVPRSGREVRFVVRVDASGFGELAGVVYVEQTYISAPDRMLSLRKGLGYRIETRQLTVNLEHFGCPDRV